MENYIRQYCRKLLTEATVNRDEFKNKYLPEMDDNIFDSIMSIDPTANISNNKVGKFALYIAKQIKDGILRKNYIDHNMAEKYKRIFKEILKLRQAKKLPSDFDVNKFNIYDLVDYIEEIDFTSNREKEKLIKKSVKLIYEDSKCLILIPLTKEASQFYGKGTTWCTSALENNTFERYNSQGDLYICISKEKYYDDYEENEYQHKFQFHFDSDYDACDLNDEKNSPTTIEKVEEYIDREGLISIFKNNKYKFIPTNSGICMINKDGEYSVESSFQEIISPIGVFGINYTFVITIDDMMGIINRDGKLIHLKTEDCDGFNEYSTTQDDRLMVLYGYTNEGDDIEYLLNLWDGSLTKRNNTQMESKIKNVIKNVLKEYKHKMIQ